MRLASKFLWLFDPVDRKLNLIFGEAEPFSCKNQEDVLKMKRQMKSYGYLILLRSHRVDYGQKFLIQEFLVKTGQEIGEIIFLWYLFASESDIWLQTSYFSIS